MNIHFTSKYTFKILLKISLSLAAFYLNDISVLDIHAANIEKNVINIEKNSDIFCLILDEKSIKGKIYEKYNIKITNDRDDISTQKCKEVSNIINKEINNDKLSEIIDHELINNYNSGTIEINTSKLFDSYNFLNSAKQTDLNKFSLKISNIGTIDISINDKYSLISCIKYMLKKLHNYDHLEHIDQYVNEFYDRRNLKKSFENIFSRISAKSYFYEDFASNLFEMIKNGKPLMAAVYNNSLKIYEFKLIVGLNFMFIIDDIYDFNGCFPNKAPTIGINQVYILDPINNKINKLRIIEACNICIFPIITLENKEQQI